MGSFLSKILGLDPVLEENGDGDGYEPSSFSRMLAVPNQTDYRKIDFPKTYSSGPPKKILIICTEEKYMTMTNGKKFSTGNHPVETLHPIMHIHSAGFDFDVATPTGKPAVLEEWALPTKDTVFMEFYNQHKSKFDAPKSLSSGSKIPKNDYVAIFFPGGHGAMLGLPDDKNVAEMIRYVKEKDLYCISICHGPAALLASKDSYRNYKIACFPDSIDKQTPMIGYLPGEMPWYFGERLVNECGMTIENKSADGTVVVDRKLITGASPKACQEIGKVTAEKLLEQYA